MLTAEAQTPTAPSEQDVAAAYRWALTHAEYEAGRSDELREAAIDAATSGGVMWALKHFNAESGEFLPFAKKAIRVAVSRTLSKLRAKLARRGPHLSLNAEDENDKSFTLTDPALSVSDTGGGPLGLPLAVEELEPDLRHAVRLYYLDGYTIRELAALTGTSYRTVWERLRLAAQKLGGGMRPRRRQTGTRRLKH